MMKEKILFMGTPPIARTMLERLVSEGYEIVGVLTQPDRRVGRKKQLQCSAVKEYALQQALPIWQPVRIRDDHEELLKVEMDLIVTCAYGQFVPQALLDHPRFGAVNLHASLLPKLRGAAPIQRAIMRGDKECGMSVMRMVKKMDAGAVMAQRALRIEEEDTSGTLFEKLAVLGADLMASSLPLIFAGEADFVEQDEEQVSFAPAITPQEERLDLCKGLDAVYDQARALIPQPLSSIVSVRLSASGIILIFGSPASFDISGWVKAIYFSLSKASLAFEISSRKKICRSEYSELTTISNNLPTSA